jgi:hypothetical protein
MALLRTIGIQLVLASLLFGSGCQYMCVDAAMLQEKLGAVGDGAQGFLRKKTPEPLPEEPAASEQTADTPQNITGAEGAQGQGRLRAAVLLDCVWFRILLAMAGVGVYAFFIYLMALSLSLY